MKMTTLKLAIGLLSLGLANNFAQAQMPPRAPGQRAPMPAPVAPRRPAAFHGIKTFMPQNRLNTQDTFRMTNMTEQEFNETVDAVIKTFAPVVRQYGGNLVAEKNWKDSTVNAYADQPEGTKTWKIAMFGGLARRPEVTKDGFLLVVCHELGHHLAGYPFVGEGEWAGAEGTSDYFATQVCARVMWGQQTEFNRSFGRNFASEIPASVKGACDSAWKDENSRGFCYRASLAGQSLATLLAALEGRKAPQFETPDPTQVRQTNTDHPAAQCRLDTYFQGALCIKTASLKLIPGRNMPAGQNSGASEKVSSQNSCYREDGFHIGVRPACWFKTTR